MNAGSALGIVHLHTCHFLRQNIAGPGENHELWEVIASP
jgi:hypothetical protein